MASDYSHHSDGSDASVVSDWDLEDDKNDKRKRRGNHRKSPGGSYGWNLGGWNFGGVGKGGAGGCFFVGGVIFGFFFGVKRNQKGSGHKKSRFLGI